MQERLDDKQQDQLTPACLQNLYVYVYTHYRHLLLCRNTLVLVDIPSICARLPPMTSRLMYGLLICLA